MKDGRIDSLEARLAEFGARIDHLVGAVNSADVITGVKAELLVWREWIDEIRLQLALGAMEGRDRIEEGAKSLELLSARMRTRLSDLEDMSDPLPGVAEAVEKEFQAHPEELKSPEVLAG